jgi:CRISPR-associated protein Csx10
MITLYYPFTLGIDAPVVLAGLDGDPNSVRSLDFVPGSALRGAAARALCAREVDRTNPEDFRLLILSGAVRYLNAYVTVQGRRGLPVPASFRRDKHAAEVYDLAGWDTGPEAQLVRLSAGYVAPVGNEVATADVAGSGRLHQQRQRAAGRPTPEAGAVFRYESLDAGQQFAGVLAITAADAGAAGSHAAALRQALGESVLLGKSRRAGYGGAARLTWADTQPREWAGVGAVLDYQPEGAVFRLLLTSDYLGRDPDTGQIDPAALAGEVRHRLRDRVEVVRGFQQFRRVGGYNRKWGLELPQGLALAAGSVLLLRARQFLPLADLLAVEHSGLGERRAEGFGRVVFLTAPERHLRLRRSGTGGGERPTVAEPPLLGVMQQRLLEEVVGQRINAVAGELARTARDIPSRSLLGRLRLPLRRPPRPALAELAAWLGDGPEAMRDRARRQLEACRLAGGPPERQSLRGWLRAVAEGQDDLAGRFGYDDLARRHHLVSAEVARRILDGREWSARVRAGLIDAVLAALARRPDQPGAPATGGLAPSPVAGAPGW